VKISLNHLLESHQMGQRYTDWILRSKGHSETTRGQIRTLGGIFSPCSRMHGHILIKLITLTDYQVHMTLIVVHFQGHGFKGQDQRQHFQKYTFTAEVQQSAVHHWRQSSFLFYIFHINDLKSSTVTYDHSHTGRQTSFNRIRKVRSPRDDIEK